MLLDRQDQSFIGRWWRTVDHYLLFAFSALILIGGMMVTTASPAVAERVGLDPFHFIERQFFFLSIGIVLIFIISLLELKTIRRLATIGFALGLICMVLVLFIGDEIKGSTRWISFGGLSLQPSEFLKPCFFVFNAWMFSERLKNTDFPGFLIACASYAIVLVLLVAQPDIGTSITFTAVWAAMFFLAGLPVIFILLLGIAAILSGILAYASFSHVRARVDKFLSPNSEENYQVSKSLEAFANGGLFGKGPGEGHVKNYIPDSHTDFIFAVIGEEMGLVMLFVIIGIFAFIVLRGFKKVYRQNDLFVTLACAGIIMNFGLQAIINMGVNLKLLPTKGMTLPFISYGGSSMIAQSISVGILLSLTRKRYEAK